LAADGRRDFDVIVWGASGFTGRLVAQHLARTQGHHGLGWAAGGRSPERLAVALEEMGVRGVPVALGDAHDARSMRELAGRARVICSTVGPYAVHGSELVAACAEAGTHYCDISGEVPWMRRMIDAHHARALETGARIVHACGFDSAPSDLGCLFVQRRALERFGTPCASVALFVRRAKGGVSGGTVASMLQLLEEARRSPETRALLADPYALNPAGERGGPDPGERLRPHRDPDAGGAWTAPFVMAGVNTRIVRRSHALMGWPWGRGFRYRERVLTGSGPAGLVRAAAVSAGLAAFLAAATPAPSRALLKRLVLPAPGEGPGEAAREAGGFEMLLVGAHPDAPDGALQAKVVGRRDPGYGATSRMLAEAAVCLAADGDRLPVGGGSWTPATALGALLIERLGERAEVRFTLGR